MNNSFSSNSYLGYSKYNTTNSSYNTTNHNLNSNFMNNYNYNYKNNNPHFDNRIPFSKLNVKNMNNKNVNSDGSNNDKNINDLDFKKQNTNTFDNKFANISNEKSNRSNKKGFNLFNNLGLPLDLKLNVNRINRR